MIVTKANFRSVVKQFAENPNVQISMMKLVAVQTLHAFLTNLNA